LAFAQIESGIKSLTDEKVELFESDANLNLGSQSYLHNLFSRTGIPAGVVFAENEDIYTGFKFQPQVLTLKEALDLFTKAKPEYVWKETNGVINIFPKNYYPILDTRISEFKIDDEFPWKMTEKLIQTKEFQRYIKERNLVDKIPDPENKHGWIFSGGVGSPNPREKRSVNLKNATVREILNEIVRKSENRFWSYQEYEVTYEGKIYYMYRLKS